MSIVLFYILSDVVSTNKQNNIRVPNKFRFYFEKFPLNFENKKPH